jgi:hypothetical protein
MFVHHFAHYRKQLCHTPKFFVRKAKVHRTVSSVLAGDCVDREIMASQLRVAGLRANRQPNRPRLRTAPSGDAQNRRVARPRPAHPVTTAD